MKVVIITPVFPPEPTVSGRVSADVAAGARARGDTVTVITSFPNRPAGRIYAGYRRSLFKTEMHSDGTKVVRCFSTLSKQSTVISRFLENVSFGITSATRLLLTGRPDVIYSNSWPLFATALLCLVAKVRGIPVVISVQDVYPESLLAQRRTGSAVLLSLLRRLDGTLHRFAREVIVISDAFARIYECERQVDPYRLHVIPNWIGADEVDTGVDSTRYRERIGVAPDSLLLVYGGNVGAASGLDTAIGAVSQLAEQPDLRLVIAGEGSRLTDFKAMAEQLAPGRVSFHHPWLKEETSVVLRAADLLILPTTGAQSLASMPSKVISYMLSARPVLALALPGSELATVIEESGCGWVVPPSDPRALAAAIEAVLGENQERKNRGCAGREYALQHFTREVSVPKVLAVLDRAAVESIQKLSTGK